MTQPGTGTAEELLQANGLTVPDGHSIVSLAERPDLIDPSDRFNGLAWPDYMLGTPVDERSVRPVLQRLAAVPVRAARRCW